ncbi:hypothetical protein Mapa_005836 [Marchantia paleacea]|nr:hypothetical protein Mapa_005836 [Marchantia paleacea]
MPHLMAAVSPTTAEFEKVYVVHRTSGFPADAFTAPMQGEDVTDSAYLSEDQAYAIAIRRQIAYMERQMGDTIAELRTLVTEKGTTIKGRFQKMREWIERTDWFADAEVVEYHVETCPLGRLTKIDTDNLLEGLEEPGYTTDTSTDEEEDDEDSDEDLDDDSSAGSKPCPVSMASNGKKRRREID